MTATSAQSTTRRTRVVRAFLGWLLLWGCCIGPSFAGLTLYVNGDAGFNNPNPVANLRTIDFSTVTMAAEQTAGRITYSSATPGSGQSVSYTTTSTGLTGFAGNSMRLTTGTSTNTVSQTVTFAGGGTPYVAFLWGVSLKDQNALQVVLTLSDGNTVTLSNCQSTASNLCVAYYTPSNWLSDFLSALLGFILGGNSYDSVYVHYVPDNGVKITQMQVKGTRCDGCGFLGFNASQYFHLDNLSYLDATVVPHHLEVTTASATASAGINTVFTVKACANAACSSLYTTGVTGTLSISGVTPIFPSGAAFTIASGMSSTTVTASMTLGGTATVALTGYSPTPSNTPNVFCGMGVPAASGNPCTVTVGQGLHHLALTASSSTRLTCTPVVYTIQACADAACTTPFTSGITGNLTVSGATVNYPAGQGFSIAASSSSTTMSAHVTTPGTAIAALSGLSVSPSNTPPVFCGMGTTASSGGSCSISMLGSALFFDVPHHASEVSQAVTVSAVQSSNNATVCAPAFASVSKNVVFKCSYSNPASGTRAVRVGGSALNASNNSATACDGSGRTVSLSFNGSGVASTTVQYADVGQMGLSATYTGSGGDAGLSMVGSDTFIVAPYAIAPTSWTPGPIKAGQNFSVTLTARNAAGNTTLNFGQELSPVTVDLTFSKTAPTGVGASNGTFTHSMGSFTSGVGVATASWSEVGTADLLVEVHSQNYLGSGLNASGSTGSGGAIGAFVPNHFTTEDVAAGCGSFTYSGQPFGMAVYARNANGVQVLNYDGSANTSPNFAKAVTLSGLGLTGTLSNGSVAASKFIAGKATLTTTSAPYFTFTNKLTAAGGLTLRAVDDDATSDGQAESSVTLRSGRLHLSNAFGSEKAALAMTAQTQYWSGKSWVINDADSCTVVPTSAVALSNYTTHQGTAAGWTTSATSPIQIVNGLSNATAPFKLAAPSAAQTGTVDVALNLGSTSADKACLGTHPSSTGASLSWLRSSNGSCASGTDFRDPAARASFGVYTPESRKVMHVRSVF